MQLLDALFGPVERYSDAIPPRIHGIVAVVSFCIFVGVIALGFVPVTRRKFSDVTLVLADGKADLGKLISETTKETFESASDIETALHNVLPRRAVGELYQSEEDA